MTENMEYAIPKQEYRPIETLYQRVIPKLSAGLSLDQHNFVAEHYNQGDYKTALSLVLTYHMQNLGTDISDKLNLPFTSALDMFDYFPQQGIYMASKKVKTTKKNRRAGVHPGKKGRQGQGGAGARKNAGKNWVQR